MRAPAFKEEYLQQAIGLGNAVAFLVPGSIAPKVSTYGGTGATVFSEVRVDLLIAKPYSSGDDPFASPYPSPDRWEEQDRMAQDATKAILSDRGVNSTAKNVQITNVEMAPEETFHPAWAVVFMSLLATVESTTGAP